MKKQIFTTTLVCLLTASLAFSQNDRIPRLAFEPFSSGFTAPLGIENAGDDRLFIIEQAGRIWICDAAGNKSAAPFLDISAKVLSAGSEQGLLGLAFHPSYSVNGFFYVNYINLNGDTRISRFRVSAADPDVADPNSELVIMRIRQPFANHNGGQMKFGPDNYLYISTGDGGDAADPFNNGQDMSTLLGKILRIDVNVFTQQHFYGIPPTNPFVGMTGVREEIWASGLRNPWRFSFDSQNGDMWIADVGQNKWEEINYQKSNSSGGENYGWGCWEGAHFFKKNCDPNDTPPTFPIAEYPHTNTPCSGSITGGYVYRGTQFPNLEGKYIYADFCSGIFRAVYKDHQVWVNRFVRRGTPFSYTTFGEDVNGELYVANAGTGEILHLVDSSALRISATVSNKEINVPASRVNLFPNPNKGEFTLTVDAAQTGNYEIAVTSQQGKIISTETKTAAKGINEWIFSLENLSSGIYVIRISSGTDVFHKKFTVQ